MQISFNDTKGSSIVKLFWIDYKFQLFGWDNTTNLIYQIQVSSGPSLSIVGNFSLPPAALFPVLATAVINPQTGIQTYNFIVESGQYPVYRSLAIFPIFCDNGYYRSIGGCQPCPYGTYAVDNQCYNCPSLTYTPSTASLTCVDCDVNSVVKISCFPRKSKFFSLYLAVAHAKSVHMDCILMQLLMIVNNVLEEPIQSIKDVNNVHQAKHLTWALHLVIIVLLECIQLIIRLNVAIVLMVIMQIWAMYRVLLALLVLLIKYNEISRKFLMEYRDLLDVRNVQMEHIRICLDLPIVPLVHLPMEL